MARREPLIVVSNRGPVGFRRGSDGAIETVPRRRAASSPRCAPLVDRNDVTWVASAMGEVEREIAGSGRRTERVGVGLARSRCAWSRTTPRSTGCFYGVIANPVLWFVQHGLWDLKQDPGADLGPAWREGYVEANRTLAAAVVEELDRAPGRAGLRPGLPPLPRPGPRPCSAARGAHRALHAHPVGRPRTRGRCSRATSRERSTRGCSRATASASTPSTGAPPSSTAASTLLGRGADAERVSHANPIAVDAEEFDALAAGDGVRERRDALAAERPEILVLRVDRADPSKNAVRGFEAFGRLLERAPGAPRPGRPARAARPLARGDSRVRGLPRRDRARRRRGQRAVRDGPDWTPVSLVVRDDFLASIAAYLEYDVLLVNPVMDGLNLVAKEAPLVNDRDGVLVLSRGGRRLRGARRVGRPGRSAGRRGPGRCARARDRPSRGRAPGVARRHPAPGPDARPGRVGRPRAPRARRARRHDRCRGYDATVSAGPDVASRELVSDRPGDARAARSRPRHTAGGARRGRRRGPPGAGRVCARAARRPPPTARARRPRARRGRRRDRADDLGGVGKAARRGVRARARRLRRRAALARGEPRPRPSRGAARVPAARAPPEARLDPLRAARRGRDRHALELPARDPASPGRGGGRRRERGDRQAVRADAALGRLGRGALPPRRRACRASCGSCRARATSARRSSGTAASPRVVFTGSVEVGRAVAQAAAERLCPVVLELGGKDAMLVLDDADLDRAVEGALWGVFTNCGQACAGIERIAVPPGLHDTFVERLTARRERAADRPRRRCRRRARAARQRGAARAVRGPRRGRGRARSAGRDRRRPAQHRPSRAGSTSRPCSSASRATRGWPARSSSARQRSLSNWTTTRRWCAG